MWIAVFLWGCIATVPLEFHEEMESRINGVKVNFRDSFRLPRPAVKRRYDDVTMYDK